MTPLPVVIGRDEVGAGEVTIDLHCADARKGTDIPYVSHLFSVCGLVIADGGTEDEAIADKLDNARAMLADHRRIGDALWARFNAGKADQLRCLDSLLRVFGERGVSGLPLDEFQRTVAALAGGTEL